MDPVSEVGIVAATAQFASLCVSICRGLDGLKDKIQNARKTIIGIRQYCITLQVAITLWIETALAHEPGAASQIAALQSAIEHYNEH